MGEEMTKVSTLEKENKELTQKLERVQSIVIAMFYKSEGLHMDGKDEASELLDKYRIKLSKAIDYPTSDSLGDE